MSGNGAASGPPSRMTSPPTTSDPWAPVPAISKSPETVTQQSTGNHNQDFYVTN